MKRIITLVGLALLLAAAAGAFTEEDGWRVAVQAWTFRSSTFSETLGKAAELGVRYIEAYPGQALGGGLEGKFHHTMDEATREKVKAKLKDAGVTLIQYGVVGGKDEAEWREIFAFAGAMGIETINSEPPKEQLDLVEKLCDEFGISLAIHNHPKPSRYWNPNTVLGVAKDRSKRIGFCADTGHYVRSGLDPVAVLNKIGGRLITLHVKDLAARKPKTRDVVYGTGKSNMNGQLMALKNMGFKGVMSIEYEHESPALMDEVGGCVAYLRAWDGSATPARTAVTNDVTAVWARAPKKPSPRWTVRDLLPRVPPKPESWLGDLSPHSVRTGPDGMKLNRSSTGERLALKGKTHEQGLGVHAPAALCYPVPEDKQRFVASVSGETGSMAFKVYGAAEDNGSDGELLARSPVLPAEDLDHWHFDVQLKGRYPLIRLVVDTPDKEKDGARAAWINAGFIEK